MFQRIKDLREDNDLTQKEVAGILEMSQTGYSKYETGDNELPVSVLIRLSFFYHTSTDYLLGLTDNHASAVLNETSRRRFEQYHKLLENMKKKKEAEKKKKKQQSRRQFPASKT